MTAVAKVENYSAEQTARMVEAYRTRATAETVEALAKEFGKSVKSVVAKLVREGVYKAKETTKAKRKTKADLVAGIAATLGLEVAVVASLEKGTHEALEAVVAALEAVDVE